MSALVPPLFRAGFPIQALVGLLIAVGLALLGAAALASLADITRIACDPESWLQGHAVWHVLSALALGAFFRFYQELAGPPWRSS